MQKPITIDIHVEVDRNPESVRSTRRALADFFKLALPDHGPRPGRIEFNIGPISEQKRT